MSTFRGANYSRWFNSKSITYNPAAVEPMADDHEMLDFNMLCLSVLDPDAVSLQSCSTPLLRLPSPEATAVKNDSLGLCEEGEQKPKYFEGWRMGVTLCAATTGIVLMINVVLTVFASIKYGLHDGFGTLQKGSCRTTKDLSLWLHLAINVLSTLLLGASNYCMQCLASPTREEVDIAHGQHVWLDIGIPSVRNLERIPRHRRVLWWLLAASAIPLHLLWNSAIFSTLSTQDYLVVAASTDLFSIAGLNWSAPIPGFVLAGNDYTAEIFRDASSWERLDNDACIKAYAQDFLLARGDLLVMSSNMSTTRPMIPLSTIPFDFHDDAAGYTGYTWICSSNLTELDEFGRCNNINAMLSHSEDWTISADEDEDPYSVEYCLSKRVEEHCSVKFSIVIMGIVIGCNCLKVLCILLTLWLQKSQPLVTLGDTLASFLGRADPTTEKTCLAQKYWFSSESWGKGPIEWKEQHRYWFLSASKKRWLTCNVLCVSLLIAASYLLHLGLYVDTMAGRSLTHLWQMGFGTVNSDSMINNLRLGVIPTVLVVNIPQMLLSFSFLGYNSLFTCMLLADEWNGYSSERKPLRVTSPKGTQRSTYRLQLPYKYGIPLLIISSTLHWLVSQSLFLAIVVHIYMDGTEISVDNAMGYSCIAIITTIFLGSIVVIVGILIGFKRYKPGIPLVGSCSAAISAACHQPKEDEDAADKPLMWGVVSTKNGVGHCCFTSFEVTAPIVGELYGSLDGHS